MEQKTIRYLIWALAAVAIVAISALVIGLTGQPFAPVLPPVPDEQGLTRGYAGPCYRTEGSEAFVCASGGTFSVLSGGTLSVAAGAIETHANAVTFSGATTLSGATSLSGAVTLGSTLIQSSTSITPTAGQTITPTVGFYSVNSSGAVSMTLAACTAAGQLVWLYGDDANTVTVNDTNLLSTDGNAVTFGQYDLVGLMCNGAAWAHAYKSANQ